MRNHPLGRARKLAFMGLLALLVLNPVFVLNRLSGSARKGLHKSLLMSA